MGTTSGCRAVTIVIAKFARAWPEEVFFPSAPSLRTHVQFNLCPRFYNPLVESLIVAFALDLALFDSRLLSARLPGSQRDIPGRRRRPGWCLQNP